MMELLERLSLIKSRHPNPQGMADEQVQQLKHAITETAVSSPRTPFVFPAPPFANLLKTRMKK
jgi:hypothetical protein